jgi:hypothetical protein
MVLVNGAQGYRVCLECHAVLEDGDEDAWLAVHLRPHEPSREEERGRVRRWSRRLSVRTL